MGLISEIEITVRSTEIDVNGHVNNAKYLEYLEWGREDWYEQCGMHYDVLKAMNVVTMVVHVSANYRKEAVQNDRLRIRTHLSRVGNTSMTLSQTIWNQRDDQVLEADFVIVTVNPELHQKTPVPQIFRDQVHSV